MGAVYDEIDKKLARFIRAQHLFFVATAPNEGGHVNVSPKGLDSFRILDPNRVAYLDLTGSGIETMAHLRDNGRITIMFCAFQGRPNIVRLYGTGRALTKDTAEYAELAPQFPEHAGARAIVVVDVDRVSDSCGYGVPNYEYTGDRDVLTKWSNRWVSELDDYRREYNAESIDGLPGWEAG